MRIRPLVAFIVCSLFLLSCEKSVTFKLDDVEPKLVVEATIENGEYPIVYLSHSLSFFSNVSPDIISNSFVHNAQIEISNGILTHQLKEYSIPVFGPYRFYYYTVDSSNLATAFRGQLNKQYSMHIVSDNKEYTAITHIPGITKQIDSIFWKPAPAPFYTSEAVLMGRFTDPPGYGDYIRYFTKRNNEPYYAGLTSVYDDQIIDGTSYTVQIDRGVPRESYGGNYLYFFKGDTITLKLCNIDKATYDFWRTMEFSYSNVGNPFSSPTKVLSNISGGALGYFGGYAVQYRTLIIPH